jgi:uncharacterized protein
MESTKLYVGRSKISGKGLFISNNVHKGQVVLIVKGAIIRRIEKTKADAMKFPNHMGIYKNHWIRPDKPFIYINHSCSPNISVKGRVSFVALRDIKKGEELFFDYSTSEDTLWEMSCYCGSNKCRKKIRGIRHLPKETFFEYFPYIPTYFKNLYLSEVLKEK